VFGCGRVAGSPHISAAGQLGSPRGAIGFRSIKLVARGSAAGQCGAPRGAIGFRSIHSVVRKSVYSRLSQVCAFVPLRSGVAPARLRLPKRCASCTVCL